MIGRSSAAECNIGKSLLTTRLVIDSNFNELFNHDSPAKMNDSITIQSLNITTDESIHSDSQAYVNQS